MPYLGQKISKTIFFVERFGAGDRWEGERRERGGKEEGKRKKRDGKEGEKRKERGGKKEGTGLTGVGRIGGGREAPPSSNGNIFI
jgi:hypothetical protein